MDTDIPGWSLHCVQTTAGALDGGTRELHAEGVQVLEEHYRHVATNHYGVAAPDSVGFVLPLRIEREGMFNGQVWRPGTICVWNTNREFNAITSPGDLLCVIVDRALIAQHVIHTEQIDLEPQLLRASLVFHVSGPLTIAATRLRELITGGFESDWRATTPAAQQAIRQEVLETLVPILVGRLDARQEHHSHFKQMATVRRAREFALANSGLPLQVQDVCSELGLSRRTLQHSFRTVLGIGPLWYLRTLRLGGARRSLLAGDSVRKAAETWGFWHLSRFSREYRRLFGELPSTTLRRQP